MGLRACAGRFVFGAGIGTGGRAVAHFFGVYAGLLLTLSVTLSVPWVIKVWAVGVYRPGFRF